MKSIVLFATILRIVLITTIISFAVYANAQNVAINTTGNSADASAMLDVQRIKTMQLKNPHKLIPLW